MKKFTYFKIIFYQLFLQTRRMQFWQSNRRKLPETSEEFKQNSEIMKKFFEKRLFEKFLFENCLLNTFNAVLLTPMENLLHKTEKNLLHVRRRKNFFNKQLSLSPNFSIGHLESRFHKPAGKISTEKFPLNKTIWWKKK